MTIPNYWKTELCDIENAVKHIHAGKTELLSKSAGGRDIYMIFYGKENDMARSANLSSALGAMDKNAYADKSDKNYRPTLMLAGGVHGGEFEGIAALLNLVSLMERGVDLKGDGNEELVRLFKQINLVIIPCINPDGRSRVPFKSMVGKTLETLRYYNQGTWKDGSLCGWPGCKQKHPVKDYVSYLGGYFNDDGVNLMHDCFREECSAEIKALLKTADRYAPELTILLHGGINGNNHILKPAYSPLFVKEEILNLEKRMAESCARKKISYSVTECDRGENRNPPAPFNLCSAIYHLCGEACITFESNQGLACSGAMSYNEIYEGHMVLFEESVRFILERSDTDGESFQGRVS